MTTPVDSEFEKVAAAGGDLDDVLGKPTDKKKRTIGGGGVSARVAEEQNTIGREKDPTMTPNMQ